MKIAAFSAALFAATVAADSSISKCAQMCYNNMLAKAKSLGCSANDFACLCANRDFNYGIHDCTIEACPSDNVEQVQAYAQSMCASTAAISGASTSSATAIEATSTPHKTEHVLTTATSGSETKTGTAGSTTLHTTPRGSGSASASSGAVSATSTATGTGGTGGSGGTGSSGGSGSSGSNTSSSHAVSGANASSTGAAHPMATIGSGAAGAIGLAALLVL